MKNNKIWFGGISVVLALALLAAFVVGQLGVGSSIARAQEATATPVPPEEVVAEPSMNTGRTITVVGEGMVSLEPDIAQATIGVEIVRPSVREASNEAQEVMEAVLDALMAAGIEERDIQTSGFSIWVERNFGPMPGPAESQMAESDDENVRYHVTNTVSVIIRNMDSVGAVLEAAIEAGANNIYGINFQLDDPTAAESEARAKAVEDAQAKAQELAGLTGTEVGAVVSISEVIGQGGGFFGGSFASAAREGLGGGGGGPISPGQLNLTLQLQVTYELR